MKVTVNHSQIQGTENSVFDNLQQTLEQFINERQWTDLQFQENERIQCNLNITVSKYNRDENKYGTYSGQSSCLQCQLHDHLI